MGDSITEWDIKWVMGEAIDEELNELASSPSLIMYWLLDPE